MVYSDQEYWKKVFSYDVLGQTDLVLNPTNNLSAWYKHQSCPWLAIVTNFENKGYAEDEYCRCCGYNSRSWYCGFCEADRCMGCGEIGCGSYMCLPCRQMNQDF